MSGLKIAVGLTTVNGYAEWFDGPVFLGLFYFSLLWVSLFVMYVQRRQTGNGGDFPRIAVTTRCLEIHAELTIVVFAVFADYLHGPHGHLRKARSQLCGR